MRSASGNAARLSTRSKVPARSSECRLQMLEKRGAEKASRAARSILVHWSTPKRYPASRGSKASGPSGVKRSNAQFRCGLDVRTLATSALCPYSRTCTCASPCGDGAAVRYDGQLAASVRRIAPERLLEMHVDGIRVGFDFDGAEPCEQSHIASLLRGTELRARLQGRIWHNVSKRGQSDLGCREHRASETTAMRYVDGPDRRGRNNLAPHPEAFEDEAAAKRQRKGTGVVCALRFRARFDQQHRPLAVGERQRERRCRPAHRPR